MTHFTPSKQRKNEFVYRSGDSGLITELCVFYMQGFNLASRGVWFALRPVTVSTDSYSLTLTKGLQVMLAPTERCKPATVRAMAERLDPIAKEIVAAWGPEPTEDGDKAAVERAVRSAFGLEVARG